MLVFITNAPRAYAWGSTDALPAILRQAPTGEPQAELWLGDHAGDPAEVAKASPQPHTLIDLIAADPDAYGVDGGPLPFLLKVLGIGGPLSLQVHPNRQQAQAGFAREGAAGLALDAPTRSYTDANHKPELLVALAPTRALCGFRPLEQVQADVSALAAAAGTCGAPGSQSLLAFTMRCRAGAGQNAEQVRDTLLDWVFSGDKEVQQVIDAITTVVDRGAVFGVDRLRVDVLRSLTQAYPNDPGVIVSLLTNVVELQPGEALFLGAGQIHAYISGLGVEVMASSDNVLRAGLTPKHVDVAELRHILNLAELTKVRFEGHEPMPGLVTWQPPIADFALHRARVGASIEAHAQATDGVAEIVQIEARYPMVLIATEGLLRVERAEAGSDEVTSVRKGQSLYISAGGIVELSGTGEAFVATVGAHWGATSDADTP